MNGRTSLARIHRLVHLSSTSPEMLLSGPFDLRRLVAVIPPSLGNAAGIARFCRGMSEYVPISDPERRIVPLWNPVAARAEDAVEHLAGDEEVSARRGRNDLLGQRIHDRIGYPGEILRALDGRRLRREVGPQSVPGGGREAEAIDRYIEIEAVDAGVILHRIDDAQGRLDPERG